MLCRRDFLGAALGLAFAQHGLAASGPLLRVFGTTPEHFERIFVAGPPAAVLIATLAPERLLGWPMRLSDNAKALLPAVVRDRPLLGRLAGRGSTVTVETLLALQPDLILDVGTVDATYISTAQRVSEQTGLTYALLDGRLIDSATQLRELSAWLGVPTRGKLLAEYADETLEQTAALRRNGSVAQGSIYLARGADGLETALAGSINGEFIEAAGARNVADMSRGGVARVSMEQLLAWAPDWIVTQDRGFFQHARTDPLWATLDAVRNGRLLLAPDVPFGWLDGPPGVNRLLGVRWLAEVLQHGRATSAQFINQAQRFYGLFYGSTPSRQVLQGWFDGRA